MRGNKAFFCGFEKAAYDANIPLSTGVNIGAALGGIAGLVLNRVAVSRALKTFSEDPEMQDSPRLIKKLRRFAPNAKFLTESELKALESGESLPQEKQIAKILREEIGKGNAFYYRPPGVGEAAAQYIAVGDKTSPSILGHEIGHYLSHEEIAKLKDEAKQNSLLSTYKQEEEAWKKAPVKVNPEVQEAALKSYRSGMYPLYGLVAGGALGALASTLSRR